jgi:hypothetical protein
VAGGGGWAAEPGIGRDVREQLHERDGGIDLDAGVSTVASISEVTESELKICD